MANNRYNINENIEEFQEEIKVGLSQGLDLIGTAYGDGKWVASYQDTPNNTGFATASSASELGQIVQQQWQVGGYRLTDVEYGDGVWFGTFEEYYGANTYSNSTSLTELQEDISQAWSLGYELVNVEYGDGIWFGTFSDVPGGNGYETATSDGEFIEDIQNMWNQGLDLVDVEYGNGIWFGTFQEDSSITSGYVSGSTFDELLGNFQQQFGSLGYELVDVEYGNGAWLGVTEKEVPQNAFENPALYPLAVALEEQKTAIMVDVLSFNDFDIPW